MRNILASSPMQTTLTPGVPQGVKNFRFWLCILGFASPSVGWAEDYPFRIEQDRRSHQVDLVAVNEGPAPIHYRLWMEHWDNLQSSRPLPLDLVAPPLSRTGAAVLYPLDSRQKWSFRFSYTSRLGNPSAIHDPQAAYRLPYPDGLRFPITQAEGQNITTHGDAGSVHAVDIDMPEGTPVLAARDGVVVRIEARFGNGAPSEAFKDKANFVDVMHNDGTWATYAHLRRNGVSVYLGEPVRQGQIIGFSGSSGYSSGPHLHFAVQKNNGQESTSLPFSFYTRAQGRFKPTVGIGYLAAYSLPARQAPAETRQTARQQQPYPPEAAHSPPRPQRAVGKTPSTLSSRIAGLTSPIVAVGIGFFLLLAATLGTVALHEAWSKKN